MKPCYNHCPFEKPQWNLPVAERDTRAGHCGVKRIRHGKRGNGPSWSDSDPEKGIGRVESLGLVVDGNHGMEL